MKKGEPVMMTDVRRTRKQLGAICCIATALICLVAFPVSAAILPMTGMTTDPSPNPAGGDFVNPYIDNTAILTSYTTSAGTVTDLSHPVSANGIFDSYNSGSGVEVRNTWGVNGTEVDGVDAFLNLDVSVGGNNWGDNNDTSVIDVGSTGVLRAQFFFSQQINAGAAGNGNDFFLIEAGGNDAIDIVPLDASGNPIGNFTLAVNNSTDWGSLGVDYDRQGNAVSPRPDNDLPGLAGVAFDLEDFSGTGTLTGVAGIGISGSSGLDGTIVGVNSQLAPAPEIPEPTSLVLILVGVAALAGPSRRRTR